MAKKTEQEISLTKLVNSMLENDLETQRFRDDYYKGKEKIKHALRRKKRIEAMVEVFKMLLQGNEFVLPGTVVSERCTPLTTYISVDAMTIMSAICGQVDRATGWKPKKTKPEEKKHYTHS